MYWAYHTLGVSPGCSRAEVHKRYRRLVKAYHPDMLRRKCLSEEVERREVAKFHEIQRAWESLEKSMESVA